MATLHYILGGLAALVALAALLVASRIPAFAQDERDHRDLSEIYGAAIVRSPSGHAVNDNTGAFTVHERTMLGFVVALLVVIVVFTLALCGVRL